MKKTILILLMGILLVGVNVHAQGNLQVNGYLAVGTSTFDAKINGVSTDEAVLNAVATKSADTTWFNGAVINAQGDAASNAAITGLSMSSTSNTTGATLGNVVGITGVAKLSGSGNVTGAVGFINSLRLQTSAGNYTVGTVDGQEISLVTASLDTGNHTITNFYGLYSKGAHNGSGTVSGTNWRHAYFEDFPDFGGTVTNMSGLWIDKQTYGSTSNYGIVLNGDGSYTPSDESDYGAAIVFGTGQCCKIYSQSGVLKATDSSGNITQFSPHDPETGEWIFFSQNVKTGRTVRVNMEQLVKAVEKLTGETFMIETMMEE